MQSGYSQSQGRGSSAFCQHWHNTLQSLQKNSTGPMPILQPVNGQNILDIPNDFSVDYSLPQGQCEKGWSSHHSLAFQQKKKLQMILGCYEPQNLMHVKPKSHHHTRIEADATPQAFAHVSVQSHDVHISGQGGEQQRKLDKTDLNNYKKHQQKILLNCSSKSPTSAVIKSDSLEVEEETSARIRFMQSSPMLCGLLQGNPINEASFPTLSTPSEENYANNCRPTSQDLHSSGPQTRPRQQQDTTSVSLQRGKPARKTDEEILDYVEQKIKVFKAQTDNGYKNTNKRLNSNNTDSLKSSIKLDTSAHSTAFYAENGQGLDNAVVEHNLSTFWLQHEVDSSEDSKAHPECAVKAGVMDRCAALEQHPTEYPQITQKTAGSLTKNDEVPLVLTTLSGKSMDEWAENDHGCTLNCSSTEEEWKRQWLNTNTNLDSIDHLPGVTWSLMLEEKRTIPKVEVGQVDCVEDLSMDPPFRFARSLAYKIPGKYVKADKMNNTEDQHHLIQRTGSKFKTQTNTIEIRDMKSLLEQSGEHSNQKHLKGKKDLGFALLENKAEGQEPLPETKDVFLDEIPQYEDISDEDQPSMITQVTKTLHQDLNVLGGFRDPQYEDISEDDNSQKMEIQKDESKNIQSQLEHEGMIHTQGPADMKAHYIPIEEQAPEWLSSIEKCCCPYYIETENGFEITRCPKCERHLERQKDQPIRCCSDQKNENAYGQNSDSESDDDFLVIPLTVLNLKFESDIIVLSDETSETEGEQMAGSCSTHYYVRHPQPINCIETYETLDSYLEDKNLRSNHLEINSDVASDRISSKCGMSSTGSLLYPTVPSETEGSSETENSSNYSSDPEKNFLTVSKCLRERSSPRPVEADDSAAENEVRDDTSVPITKAMACPTSKEGPSAKSTTIQKLKQLINTKSSHKRNRPKFRRRRYLKPNDTSDSESADESGQNCKKVKRLFSSRSDPPNTQHPRHPPKVYHSQFEDGMNDYSAGSTGTTEKTRRVVETTISSKNVSHKHKRCKISESDFSDTRVKRDPDLKKGRRKNSSSELRKLGKAQKHSHEPAQSLSKTSTEPVKKSKPLSLSSHAPNKVCFSQLGDITKKPSSELSNSRHPIKANVVYKQQHKTSEDKGIEPKRRSSESGNQLCRVGGKTSGKSTEKPQSVVKVLVSKLSSSSTIPHLVPKVREHSDKLKLSNKDETRISVAMNATKKDDSSKKQYLENVNKSERGKFMSKPQLPEDKHHDSKNMDQASKAKLLSRRISLPNRLPSTSKNTCESRKRSAHYSRVLSSDEESSNQLTLEQNQTILKQHSSRLHQSHFSSVPSQHGTPSGSGSPSSMQTSAKKQVIRDWNCSYFPTRKDKKTNLGAEEDARANSTFFKNTSEKLHQESSKEVRLGPSHERIRHRHNSHELARPLMKRAKDDFRKLSEGRIRDPSTEQSCNVGEGYKWKDKLPAVRLQKVAIGHPHRSMVSEG